MAIHVSASSYPFKGRIIDPPGGRSSIIEGNSVLCNAVSNGENLPMAKWKGKPQSYWVDRALIQTRFQGFEPLTLCLGWWVSGRNLWCIGLSCLFWGSLYVPLIAKGKWIVVNWSRMKSECLGSFLICEASSALLDNVAISNRTLRNFCKGYTRCQTTAGTIGLEKRTIALE